MVSLYDIDKNKALGLSRRLQVKALVSPSLDHLIRKSDLVIEAAEAKSAFRIAKRVLNKGRDIIIMSVGGVAAGVDQLDPT